MEIWAKIFESYGKLVLVEKGSDDDGNPQVLFRWREDDFSVSIGPSWCDDSDENFDKCDKFFERVNQDIVDAFVSKIRQEVLNQ